MTAHDLTRQLTEAAARAATMRRAAAPAPAPADSGGEPATLELVAVDPGEVPTGWWAYGRAIWPLDDDITDDRVLVEGTDRRSYAALNHYLREGENSGADRARGLRRDVPTITEGRVGFERAGDTVRVTTNSDQVPADPAPGIAVLIADR